MSGHAGQQLALGLPTAAAEAGGPAPVPVGAEARRAAFAGLLVEAARRLGAELAAVEAAMAQCEADVDRRVSLARLSHTTRNCQRLVGRAQRLLDQQPVADLPLLGAHWRLRQGIRSALDARASWRRS